MKFSLKAGFIAIMAAAWTSARPIHSKLCLLNLVPAKFHFGRYSSRNWSGVAWFSWYTRQRAPFQCSIPTAGENSQGKASNWLRWLLFLFIPPMVNFHILTYDESNCSPPNSTGSRTLQPKSMDSLIVSV